MQVCHDSSHKDAELTTQCILMVRVVGAALRARRGARAQRVARTLDLIAARSIVRSNDTVRLEPLALPEIFATMEAR